MSVATCPFINFQIMNVIGHDRRVAEIQSSWESLCPRKNVNIIAARIGDQNQRVDVGTFVELFDPHTDGGKRCVVRIINRDRTSSPRDGMKWICCVYKHFIGSNFQGSHEEVVLGLGANVAELFQTDQTLSVFAHEIRCIAFVFHFHELKSRAACLHGFDNGYFVRFRARISSHHPTTVTEIDMKDWFAFPCESKYFKLNQSYVKTVFVGLDYVKHLLGLAANRCSNTQGPYPKARFTDIFYPFDVWGYIKSRAFQLGEDVELEKKVKKRKVSRLVTNISISSVSFGVMENIESLNFVTEDGFLIVQKIFGMGSIWGFRHRRPKYRERKVAQRMDTMNAAFGDDCYIKFSYNTTANRLGIAVQFESFLFDFDADGNLIECPSSHFESYCSKFGVDDGNSDQNAVVVGAFFVRHGLTYEIEQIQNEIGGKATVFARVIDGAGKGDVRKFDNEYESIGDCVREYYK